MTRIREKEFQRSTRGRASNCPFTHISRSQPALRRAAAPLAAAAAIIRIATVVQTRRSRAELLDVFACRSPANSTAATAAMAAVPSTAVGASVRRSIGPTSRQPTAAPVRSAAYKAPTWVGNRVSASDTTTPLITKGTDRAAYVKARAYALTSDGSMMNGMAKWVR